MLDNVHRRGGGRAVLGCAAMFCIGCSDDGMAPYAGPPTEPGTGRVRVTATTVGPYPDRNGYNVSLDGGSTTALGANGSVTLTASAGNHALELADVAAQCAVAGDNPRTVTVNEGFDVEVAFQVTCGAALSIALWAGDGQTGRVGHLLADPLVVLVTDPYGEAVERVSVRWNTGPAAALEGRFGDDGEPVMEHTALTDGDGLAQATLMPVAFTRITTFACVNESCARFSADASDPGARIALVSGGDQVARAGEVGEPMVVRVTDGEGGSAPFVAVDWSVWLGEGALAGRFGEDGRAADSDRVRTDADGLASISVMPTWFGPVLVDAAAAGVQDSPLTLRLDATDLGAGLTAVSGDGQDGKAGEALGEPFVVGVHDGRGEPVANVHVSWSVEGGSGALSTTSYSDPAGEASVLLSPRSLGTVRVVARLPGLTSWAVFMAHADVLVIHYLEGDGGWTYFDSPVDATSCDWSLCWVYVPVGTPVEWVSHVSSAHIVSTSVPAGGTSIDSGVLAHGERFLFIPTVTGTWEYKDQITGAYASLVVY